MSEDNMCQANSNEKGEPVSAAPLQSDAGEEAEDTLEFGAGRWVYCNSHLRPHQVGWCTVSNEDKTLLEATTREGAYAEARARGFEIWEG